MNHKWKDNKCTECGIEREKKNYRKKVKVISVLRNGVWEDKPIYTFGIKWYYGDSFKRPECKGDCIKKYADSIKVGKL